MGTLILGQLCTFIYRAVLLRQEPKFFLDRKSDNFFTKNGDFPGESPKMVTILVKEQVIFLVIAENREIPVTIIVTFFGDNIVTKYGDDFFTGNGGFPSESP